MGYDVTANIRYGIVLSEEQIQKFRQENKGEYIYQRVEYHPTLDGQFFGNYRKEIEPGLIICIRNQGLDSWEWQPKNLTDQRFDEVPKWTEEILNFCKDNGIELEADQKIGWQLSVNYA